MARNGEFATKPLRARVKYRLPSRGRVPVEPPGGGVATYTGDLSRSRSVGLRLGGGERLPDIAASMKEVGDADH